VQLLQAVLDRIAAVDERLHSYITLLADRAQDAARKAGTEIAAGHWRGPLHGIPYGVKDNYHVRGVRTTGGSRLMLEHVADETSTLIERLDAARAILLGKMNTWEYGTGAGEILEDLPFPLARNPWNVEHFTGGSSTGVGVGVGRRRGDLRSRIGYGWLHPYSCCGNWRRRYENDLRPPEPRRLSANCRSLDVTGPLTWTVEYSAIVLKAVAG
jgi:aspartyl-tRNA(Asn)/glutamyl-tRNA(Gln) amidotransferase subunit A